jgi:thiamine-phosphate pyrophosphorylase
MTLADQVRLMVVTDAALLKGRDAVDVCRRAVAGGGGATMIQVRWKGAGAAELVLLTRSLVAALPVPVIVNDRVDVALAAGAAGAHLGQDDLPTAPLRPHLPAGFLVGVSVGDPVEADRALVSTADYWSIGPCYPTANKSDAGPALLPEGFAALAHRAPPGVPVIGIGGITAANAGDVMRAGAAGIAVIGAVLAATDPRAAAVALRTACGAPGR